MSPEIIQKKPYAKEVDIWAYGIFAYEIAMGEAPFARDFSGQSNMGMFNKILRQPAPDLE